MLVRRVKLVEDNFKREIIKAGNGLYWKMILIKRGIICIRASWMKVRLRMSNCCQII